MTFNARNFTLGLLKTPTDRDKQHLVGASNLSTMCDRCLADDLLGMPGTESPYWLGAKIGTAIHTLLEGEARKFGSDGVLPEQKLILGEIPGYGVVKSTSDLVVFDEGVAHVTDFKTTKRDKLKMIRRVINHDDPDPETRFKVNTYLNQLMLYGMGVQKKFSAPVRDVSLVFICRDGVGDADVWGYTWDYDPERAQQVWDRGTNLWAWLQDGGDADTLDSAPGCYTCERER